MPAGKKLPTDHSQELVIALAMTAASARRYLSGWVISAVVSYVRQSGVLTSPFMGVA